MKIAVLFTLSLGFAIAIAPQGTTPVIEHDPSRCFEVGTFPKLCAQVTADGSLGQARAYFRASRTTKWYYVELTEDDGELCSALPSPLPETRGVEYYIEVVDEEFRPAITPTTEAQVVSDGGCRMSVYETAGVVSVFSLATGALEAPAGFAGTSVATAGGSSGAGAAGGAAGAGSGGGLSGVTIGAIAAGAGAATAVAVPVVARGRGVEYTLSGGPDPSVFPAVDDIIRIFRNGSLIQEIFPGCPNCLFPPFSFRGEPGDSLTIEAWDIHLEYLLSPLWIHRDGQSTMLTSGVPICSIPSRPCPTADLPHPGFLFFRETYTLS